MNKTSKIILGAVIAVAALVGLLWYYQQQGIIKIFPTTQDRQIQQLLSIDPSKFSAAQGMTNDQFEAAIKRLQDDKAAVEKDPTNAQAWLAFGNQKEYLNDHAGAAAVWEKTLELQPQNFVAASNLGNIYQYFLKDFPKAEAAYRQALAARSDYTSAWQGLADLYRYNMPQKRDQLEPTMLEAVGKDAINAATYYNTLVEYFAADQPDLSKAKMYWTKVKALNPAAAQQLLSRFPQLKTVK